MGEPDTDSSVLRCSNRVSGQNIDVDRTASICPSHTSIQNLTPLMSYLQDSPSYAFFFVEQTNANRLRVLLASVFLAIKESVP